MDQLYHPTVEGMTNCIADCLSCYYETDRPDDEHPDHELVSAGTQLDPEGEFLLIQQYVELRTTMFRRSCCLVDKPEQRMLEIDQMNRDTAKMSIKSSDN